MNLSPAKKRAGVPVAGDPVMFLQGRESTKDER